MDPNVLDALRRFVWHRVAEGFADEGEVAALAAAVFREPCAGEDVAGLAARLAEQAVAEHLVAQRSWPIPTDCDRLDRAFAALERRGIVARQHFACCQPCGHVEIWDEVASAPGAVEGYVFYHRRDTEAAAAGFPLWLAFGAVEEGDDAGVEVGRRIVEAVAHEGLHARWDGTLEHRIAVDLLWRKRRRVRRAVRA